jgi:V8-like Glu-specific endopeptidase
MTNLIEHKLKETTIKDKLIVNENEFLKTIPYIPNYLKNRQNTIENGYTNKVVIGKDDRYIISNTCIFPFSTIVQMTISFPSRNKYLGSGVVISKNHILTVGHNLYKDNEGGLTTNLLIVPGKTGKTEPFNRFIASSIFINEQFPENNITQNDIGLIRTLEHIGEITGYVGLALNNIENQISIIGYPFDRKKGQYQYKSDGVIQSCDNNIINYKLDTSWGQSGSGIFLKEFSNFYVSGVHSRSNNIDSNEGLILSNETITSLTQIINT